MQEQQHAIAAHDGSSNSNSVKPTNRIGPVAGARAGLLAGLLLLLLLPLLLLLLLLYSRRTPILYGRPY